MINPFDFSTIGQAPSVTNKGSNAGIDSNRPSAWEEMLWPKSNESQSSRSGGTFSSGGGGYRPQETGSTTTSSGEQRVEYQGDAPTYKKYDYDRSRVDELAQKHAGRGLRKASEGLLRAITGINTGGIDNPIARAQMYREAMQGYSSGIGNVFGQAEMSASNEYGQEYSAGAAQHAAKFQADTRAYERTGIQKSSQTSDTQRTYGNNMESNPGWDIAKSTYYREDDEGNLTPRGFTSQAIDRLEKKTGVNQFGQQLLGSF